MMEAFQQHNENWKNIRVVMADKDIGERDVAPTKCCCSHMLIPRPTKRDHL